MGYSTSDPGHYNQTKMGLVLGLLGGGIYGYMHWGTTGLALGLVGAVVGQVGETALTAGRSGRANLLLALAPLSVFAIIAYVIYKYFRGGGF